ncbi:hypothetical protein ACHAP5_000520 [Fusarium lateritium]
MAKNTLDDLLNAPSNQIRAVLRALCQDTGTRSRALSYLEDLQAIDGPSNSRELEVDYDANIWADHDERCHGTIDSKDMREEHPEGFTWNCCEKPGDEIGCKLGRHEADPDKSRREAGCEPSDAEEEDSEDYDDDE